MPIIIPGTLEALPGSSYPLVPFDKIGGTHHDGIGPPTTAPTRAGLLSIDNEGNIYASGDEIINIATHPTITTHQVGPGHNEWTMWRGAGIDGSLTADGYFQWNLNTHGLRQRRGTVRSSRTWEEIVQYIEDNSLGFPTGISAATVYLGKFTTENAAALAAAHLSGFNLATGTYVFIHEDHAPGGGSTEFRLKRVLTYVAGDTTPTEALFWRDRPLTRREIADLAGEESERHRPTDKPKQVSRIPETEDEPVLNLTHDEYEGSVTADHQTVTLGEAAGLYGYSDGEALQQSFGAVTGSSPVSFITGTGVGAGNTITSFVPEIVGSHNRGFVEDIRTIVIDGTDYALGDLDYRYGAFRRTITSGPRITTGSFTYNFKDADGNLYFTDSTTVANEAGLYWWNPDLTTPVYELVRAGVDHRRQVHVLLASSYTQDNRRIQANLATGETEVAGDILTLVAPSAIGGEVSGTAVSLYLGGANAAHTIVNPAGDDVHPGDLEAGSRYWVQAIATSYVLIEDPGTAGTLFGRGEPPEATAARVGLQYLDLTSKVLYGCFDDPHRTSESTGDFDDIARTDIEINLDDRLEDITVVENEWLYRVSSNRFYAGTDVGSNQLAWVDDTADDALAASLVTATDEVVWLGRHLDNEEALQGLTAIETGKEYFFYREQDGTIVRLDSSSFSAAGSTVAHPFWFPVKADDREEHVFDARDGLPTLANDGSDDNRIGVTNDGVYIVDVDPISATDPTADSWADFSDMGYEGAFAADPTIDTGEWYANYVRRTFREFQSTNFGLGWIPHGAPDGFIGWYESRQDALNHAAARGVAAGANFVAFTGTSGTPKVETATNFSPATSARIQRNWVFMPVAAADNTKADTDLQNLKDLSDTEEDNVLAKIGLVRDHSVQARYLVAPDGSTVTANHRWNGNFYEVKRDFSIKKFSVKVHPSVDDTYYLSIFRVTMEGAADFEVVAGSEDRSGIMSVDGGAEATISYTPDMPYALTEGHYVWVGVYSSGQSHARAVREDDAAGTVVDAADLLDFAGWSQFAGMGSQGGTLPTGNIWHANANDGRFFAEIEAVAFDATTYTVVEDNGFLAALLAKSPVINFEGAGVSVKPGTGNKVLVNIPGGAIGDGSDGVADNVTFAYDDSTRELTVTIGRTVGADLTDSVTLPVSGALSSATPSEHGIGQSGAAGTSTEASRSDHVHAIPVGVPVATGTANAEGTATTAARSDHVHQQGVFSWGFQVDTLIVPELNQDAISTARIVLEDSGLTHYLTFKGWTAADIDSIRHLPVGAHIGLRQGTTTRLLQVEAEWDSTNDRYQVINVNTGILTEGASGTATELLLTAGVGGGTTYTTGTTFPASPASGQLFEFNGAAASITAKDYDGTTDVTSAARGDLFKYDSTSTNWVKQSAISSAADLKGQRIASITFGAVPTSGSSLETTASGSGTRLDSGDIGGTGSDVGWVRDTGAPTAFTVERIGASSDEPVINVPQTRAAANAFGYLVELEILPSLGTLANAISAVATSIIFTAESTETIAIGDELRIESEVVTVDAVPADGATGEAARTYGIARGSNAATHTNTRAVQRNEYELESDGIILQGGPSPQQGGSNSRSTVSLGTGGLTDATGIRELGVRLTSNRSTVGVSGLEQVRFIDLISQGDNAVLLPSTRITVYLAVIAAAGAAAEGGQESPGNEGVAELTADIVTVTFWKWVETSDGKPTDPAAHWRFDDEWDGTTPESADGGGWYTSRATALDEADNNPDFSEDTFTLWIATEQVRRRVVNDAYSYTDGGYTVTAAWDIQYSTDGITWVSTEPDLNAYVRYRDQETGEFGPTIPVGTNVGSNDWIAIRTNDLVYPAGANVDELDAVYDFGNFSELLFIVAGYRSVSVDDGMGGTIITGVNGPWHQYIVSRGGGWPVADAAEGEDNNDADDGSCFQFTYFATNTGVGLQIWERGDDYVDPGNPPFLQDDGEPPRQLGGHFKIVSTDGDEAHVTKFRFFAFSHQFARTTMSIFARYRNGRP